MKIRKLFLRKISYSGIIVIGIITIITFLSTTGKADNPEDIIFSISFDDPIIKDWNVSNITYHNVTMNNTYPSWDKGYPILPVKPLRILLPQNGTFILSISPLMIIHHWEMDIMYLMVRMNQNKKGTDHFLILQNLIQQFILIILE